MHFGSVADEREHKQAGTMFVGSVKTVEETVSFYLFVPVDFHITDR